MHLQAERRADRGIHEPGDAADRYLRAGSQLALGRTKTRSVSGTRKSTVSGRSLLVLCECLHGVGQRARNHAVASTPRPPVDPGSANGVWCHENPQLGSAQTSHARPTLRSSATVAITMRFKVTVTSESPLEAGWRLNTASIPTIGPSIGGFSGAPNSWTIGEHLTAVLEAGDAGEAVQRVREVVGDSGEVVGGAEPWLE